jgi:DNA-binding Xre family transcriptional regulator
MKIKGRTTYDLKYKLKIGGSTYNRLKTNQSVTTHTIGMLCEYLDCDVVDIMCWEKKIIEVEEQKFENTETNKTGISMKERIKRILDRKKRNNV